MNRLRRLVLISVALVSVLGSHLAVAEPHKDRCVVMVTIDGLANFYVDEPKSDVPVMRKLGLIQGSGKEEKRTAYCMAEGGACGVYIMDPARRDQIARQLRSELAKLEGVQAVFGAEEFARIGQPTPEQNPRGADLWLAAKREYAFSESSSGDQTVNENAKTTGTHGFLPDQPDMLSLCIVSGPGLKPGTKLGKIRAIDIAPTVARILGVDLPTAEGKPIEKLLTD